MCAVNNAVNTDNVATEAEQCCPAPVTAGNMKHNLRLRGKCSNFCQISTVPNINFQENPSGGSCADWMQTDRHDEANRRLKILTLIDDFVFPIHST
jgi:hypothetical protein